MHEFGAFARGAGRVVRSLDESGLEAARLGVERDAAACGAATDDEYIELVLAQAAQLLLASGQWSGERGHIGGQLLGRGGEQTRVGARGVPIACVSKLESFG